LAKDEASSWFDRLTMRKANEKKPREAEHGFPPFPSI
jgi:hypothetical protein